MPRTASTRRTPKPTVQGRANKKPSSELDRVPVLLRLPEVEVAAEDIPDAMGAFEEPNIPHTADDENAPPAPGRSRESVQGVVPKVDRQASQAADFDQTRVPEPAPEQSVIAPASTPSNQPATATVQVAPEETVDEEAEQSWWEHWSSGIVLILLIIALVTASIFAFSDTSQDPSLLAESPDRAGDSSHSNPDMSLEEIEIPGLGTSESSLAGSTQPEPPAAMELVPATTTEVATPVTAAPAVENLAEQKSTSSTEGSLSFEDPVSNALESEPTVEGSLLVDNEPTLSAQPAQTPSLSEGFVPNNLVPAIPAGAELDAGTGGLELSNSHSPGPPVLPGASSSPTTQPVGVEPSSANNAESSLIVTGPAPETPSMQSQLQAPTAQSPAPLFPNLPLPTNAGSVDSGSQIAIGGTQNGTPPLPTETSTMPASDMANTIVADTNMPSLESMLGNPSQANTFSTAAGPTGANMTTASHQSEADVPAEQVGAPQQTGPSGVKQTSEPDFDPEALIRAYQEFANPAVNRYEAGASR